MPPKNTPLVAWSPSEDQFLRDHFQQHSHLQLAQLTGRTVNAVRNRCSLLRLRRAADRWSDAEIDVLRQWYADHPNGMPLRLDDLTKKLGKQKTSVSRKARELGLTNRRRQTVERVNGRRVTELPKFSSYEERIEYLSAVRKQWLIDNDHPRGMLGKHHTQETKDHLAETTRAFQSSLTSEDREAIRRKTRATLEAAWSSQKTPSSRSRRTHSRSPLAGYRDDLDLYVRSGWEANYARYLNLLVDLESIAEWQYESETFVFHGEDRGAIAYTPDFTVTLMDGSVVYHEVKGWMDNRSIERLARMEKHYPDVCIELIGEPEYIEITRLRELIPEWESDRRDIAIDPAEVESERAA